MLRRFRQRGLGFAECPVEPGRQRFDILRLDGGAAPDAQARRRVAIVGDVVGDAFLLEQAGERLGEGRLRIARDGTKASMLKSYKFESRQIVPQEIEGNPDKVPFEVLEPASDTVSLGSQVKFAVKLKRESKALAQMVYEWTGEVTADGRGYRIIGTGASGTFQIPANIAMRFPASLHVKVTALNGLGKAYTLDRNYTLTK